MTKIVAQPKSFAAVAAMSLHLVNADDESAKEFREELVYVANHSMVSRYVELVPGALPDHSLKDPFFTGLWEGFGKEAIVQIAWTSASSGARLILWKEDGRWWLQYEGPEGDGRESRYLQNWFHTVNPATVEVWQLNDGPVLAMLKETKDVDHEMFIAVLGISVPAAV
jgi:hypothetical protein